MNIEDTDMRGDIAAALDSSGGSDEVVETPAAPVPDREPETVVADAPIGETQEQADARARDDKGRFAKIGDKPTIKTDGAKPPPPTDKPPVEAAPAIPEAPKVKAPASWKPMAREGWDKVPPDIQQEVIRRERETAMALQETAEARQTYQQFKQTVGPYEHLFRAEGVDAMTGINNLMRTTAMLASGPQQTRAQIVAGIIKTYGVDIPTLDALLSGQEMPPQQNHQPQPPQQMRDPRLDALIQQAEQRTQKQAFEQIQAIEGEEFFEDVRLEMADLIDVAERRGFALTAKQAYDKAVALHPEISRIVEQRKAAANQNGSTQRARVAASSIRGNPTAGVAAPSGGSLTDDLNAAWDSLNTRR